MRINHRSSNTIPTQGEIHIKLGKLLALVDNLFSIFEAVHGAWDSKHEVCVDMCCVCVMLCRYVLCMCNVVCINTGLHSPYQSCHRPEAAGCWIVAGCHNQRRQGDSQSWTPAPDNITLLTLHIDTVSAGCILEEAWQCRG